MQNIAMASAGVQYLTPVVSMFALPIYLVTPYYFNIY